MPGSYIQYTLVFKWPTRMLCWLLFPLLLLSAASCNKKNTRGKIRSVLILGNSIVKHGAAPQIGWQGDWGMAASARDSDFVHLLTHAIQLKDSTVKVSTGLVVGFEGSFEKFPFSRLDSFRTPDMLIIRLSENVDDEKAANGQFLHYYDSLIRYIDPHDEAVKVIVNGVWKRPVVSGQLKEYANQHNYVFVRNDDLLADSSNFAWGRFANEGVASHPSDKGMRMIKERIWAQIKDFF